MIDAAAPLRGRVLVVDDAESNRYVLGTWLRRAGHEVVEARSGTEALAAAAGDRLDLVVLDVNLPDVSGYEVCERLKAAEHTAMVPVLHVSATAVQPVDRSEGLRRGADGFLVEPVEREELLATVQALLRGAGARRTALRLAERLRLLNDATLAIYEITELGALAPVVAEQAARLFGAAATVVIEDERAAVRAFCEPGCPPRAETCSTETAAAFRHAVGDATSVSAGALGNLGLSFGSSTYLAAPLQDGGGHRGLLLVERCEPVGDEDEVVLTQYARAASNALRNILTFDIERRIALALQHNLLPDAVETLPGLDVAVRYRASAEHAEVGGDFYEIFSLDDDRIAFAVGDVAGHSLEAAMVMAQLRTAVRSYMLEGRSPAQTLERLNRLLCRFHPDVTATVCCAVYDRRSGRCELANAGHPPPLLVTSGSAQLLPLGGPLLGVEIPGEPAHGFTLHAGTVLVLYTDGLVERRKESLDDGLGRLAACATATPPHRLEELCDRILREVGPQTPIDDIALVALRPQA